MPMWGYNPNYAGMTLGMVAMWLFWLGLAALAIWALVWLARRSLGPTRVLERPSALEILETRYARGEIDAATFNEMRVQLLQSEREPVSTAQPR